MSRPTLNIILGSTRPGRVGEPVADWFAGAANAHDEFLVEITDLAELDLPLLNEPNHPRLGEYLYEATKRWSSIISRADAVVFVIPEYNHSFNAATKNAIDYLHNEWLHKPAGIVSYGGVSAGTRAAAALRTVLSALGMMMVPAAVNIPFVAGFLDGDGKIRPNAEMAAAAQTLLEQLARASEICTAWRTPART